MAPVGSPSREAKPVQEEEDSEKLRRILSMPSLAMITPHSASANLQPQTRKQLASSGILPAPPLAEDEAAAGRLREWQMRALPANFVPEEEQHLDESLYSAGHSRSGVAPEAHIYVPAAAASTMTLGGTPQRRPASATAASVSDNVAVSPASVTSDKGSVLNESMLIPMPAFRRPPPRQLSDLDLLMGDDEAGGAGASTDPSQRHALHHAYLGSASRRSLHTSGSIDSDDGLNDAEHADVGRSPIVGRHIASSSGSAAAESPAAPGRGRARTFANLSDSQSPLPPRIDRRGSLSPEGHAKLLTKLNESGTTSPVMRARLQRVMSMADLSASRADNWFEAGAAQGMARAFSTPTLEPLVAPSVSDLTIAPAMALPAAVATQAARGTASAVTAAGTGQSLLQGATPKGSPSITLNKSVHQGHLSADTRLE